jgi:hypothetical protein
MAKGTEQVGLSIEFPFIPAISLLVLNCKMRLETFSFLAQTQSSLEKNAALAVR